MYGALPYGAAPYGAAPSPAGPPVPIEADLLATMGTLAGIRSTIPVLVEDAMQGAEVVHAWIWPAIADTLTAGDAAAPDVLANLIDRLASVSTVHAAAHLVGNAGDTVAFQTTVLAAWQILLEENVATAGDAVGTVQKIAALADAMAATGIATGNLRALAAIVEAIAMEGLIQQGFTPSLVDSTTLTDATTAVARLLLPAVDGLLVSDAAVPMLRISAVAADGVELASPAEALMRANADLADGVILYVTLRLGGVDYVGWALNSTAHAASQHANAAFDSFATFKGRDYGAGPGGLMEFTGKTDDGEPIAWSLKTFLTDFGTGKFKRMPDVYIGAHTDGRLVVKVLTREPSTGVLVEDWYYVQRSPADGPGMGRAKVGRGLKSTWWAVELCNVAGADLDGLDSIELRPLILDRRV